MKVPVVILVVLVASGHAFFLPQGGGGTNGNQGSTGQTSNPLANNPFLGSMHINLLKQMLQSIIPKILSNPVLRAAFTGQSADPSAGNGAAAGNMYLSRPAASGMGMPMAPSMGPPMGSPMGPPMGPGGPGYFAPGSDKMKEMQIMDLLHDPEVGLITDPQIAPHIPPRSIYGMSMPDAMKDFIQHTLLRRQHTRALSVKENSLMHLIGDPPTMSYFPPAGAGYGRMAG